jgi:hypothetical protein
MVRRNGAAPPDDQRPITADVLVHAIPRMVIASAAKQSRAQYAPSPRDCFVAAAPRNDKRGVSALFSRDERGRRMGEKLSDERIAPYEVVMK